MSRDFLYPACNYYLSFTVQILVEQEIFVSGEETINMRVTLSCAQIEGYGVLFLTAFGPTLMLQWHVDSQAMPFQVRCSHNNCVQVKAFKLADIVVMKVYRKTLIFEISHSSRTLLNTMMFMTTLKLVIISIISVATRAVSKAFIYECQYPQSTDH